MKIHLYTLFLILIPFSSLAEYPNCPTEANPKYKLKMNDLDVCILEHLNLDRDSERVFDQQTFIDEAEGLLFIYSDIDKSECLTLKELKQLTSLFSDDDERKKRLELEMIQILDEIYDSGIADSNILSELKFLPEPDQDVFIAALSAKPNISAKLFCEKEDQLGVNKKLSALTYASKYLWSDKFDTWSKQSQSSFDINTGIQIMDHSVKVEKNKIDEKNNKKEGLTRGVRIFKSKDSDWNKTFSVGNKFDDSFTQEFSAPAGLNFKKTASEETAESLALAYRFDFSRKKNAFENWRYSLGHSIEKSTGKAESKDIRGYHYSQNKFFRNTGVDIEIAALDNFDTGYELWVGNVGFSPFISNKGGCGVYRNSATWLNVGGKSCNEIVFNQWKYYYIPIFGVETNQLKQKPNDPEIQFNDDENYAYFKFQGGLKKGNMELSYTNTRRYNVSGGKHLSFQELNIDFYFDELQRFSIGVVGKKGQRPIDIESSEVYELKLGFKL